MRNDKSRDSSIMLWVILTGFIVMGIAALEGNDPTDIGYSLKSQKAFSEILNGIDGKHYLYKTRQAAILADVWQVSADDASKPIKIW